MLPFSPPRLAPSFGPPCNVREEQPDGTLLMLPRSQWEAVPTTGNESANLPTRFDGYEIHGVREFDDGGGKYCEQVPDDEAMFWSL